MPSDARSNAHEAADKFANAYDNATDKLPNTSAVRENARYAADRAVDAWETLSQEAQNARRKAGEAANRAAEEWENVKEQLPSQEEIKRKADYAAGKIQEGLETFETEASYYAKKAGGAVERVGAPIASYFSNTDPLRQWLMAGLCVGASGYAFSYLRNTNAGWFAAGVGALYAYGGHLIGHGEYQLGYDVSSAASIGVIALSTRKAFSHSEGYSVILAALGGVTGVTNITKAYQLRYGKYSARRPARRY
ncbi:hypothetical protein K493DRAFT_97361 [Basidiobolus meristosporus CBS 931.73]|uniref:Uncharacterized protein n=1 Tax=Basidiobolus meristosporus CBS 931.73 TaxID=1314790 RepID=A0A1Y1X454_9FUNG|nr:hypothetical protein K493DRAFT_97361 [Basidiobolus meristosporus CBS 931.73]|eukprot:ORX80597.1 hypothetical protein K493DRAFT_97361 [Basidiobolus meristosporus CBS 931.73]